MVKRVINSDKIDWENSTKVISSAQKFILPIPEFKDGGEPLVYPENHEKAGQSITDWQGNPIEGRGLVFCNYKDNCHQAVRGDGTGVIIFNLVTKEQAKKLHDKITGFNSNPDELSIEQIKEVLEYAKEELGLGDRYNSDKNFVRDNMSRIGEDKSHSTYGLHKRDDRDICHAVFVKGSGGFQGPAVTAQEFDDSAVILKQGNDVRLVQPGIFEQSYKHENGNNIKVSELSQMIHNAFTELRDVTPLKSNERDF